MLNPTVEERAASHGDAATTARLYARDPLAYSRDMIRAKIARITSGDANFEDHWIDIIGYAEIALAIIRKG